MRWELLVKQLSDGGSTTPRERVDDGGPSAGRGGGAGFFGTGGGGGGGVVGGGARDAATRGRGGGGGPARQGAEGAASSPARTPRPKPVVATRRTRDVRPYAGCAGCADADADAAAAAAAATARGTTRRAARRRREGQPRAGEWRGGTPRRRGVLGAPRDARPLGSSPPRAPRRRGGARGLAPRRRAASRSRRGPPSCRSTYPSGHVPPRGGMDERGRRRGERRRGVNARPSRFDLFRRGKRAPPVILLGECPGKSGVRGGASAIIAIARSLEPGRRDRSCCHLGGSGSGECRGYFWARANLANLSTQE